MQPEDRECIVAIHANRSYRHIFFSLALAAATASARAHSTQIYISTPFAPPRHYEWVILLYIILQLAWFMIARKKYPTPQRLRQFLFIMGLSMIGAYAIGAFMAGMNTAPPPGFGPPYPAFYGYGWQAEILILFALGNLLGLGMLAAGLILFSPAPEQPTRRNKNILLAGCIAIYCACLSPFVITGALTHGWHGGYINGQCNDNMESLTLGMASYAKEHQGRLPQFKSLEELYPVIRPNVMKIWGAKTPDSFHTFRRFCNCPFESSYERNPRPYILNPKVLNLPLAEWERLDDGTPIITCPRIHDGETSPSFYTIKKWLSTTRIYRL